MSHKEVQNARLKFVGHVLDRFKSELRSFLDSSQGEFEPLPMITAIVVETGRLN